MDQSEPSINVYKTNVNALLGPLYPVKDCTALNVPILHYMLLPLNGWVRSTVRKKKQIMTSNVFIS